MSEIIFTEERMAEFADCDSKYDLKPQTFLAWASELAGNHLRSRNITREQMWEDGQVFLLTQAAIHYNKVPVFNTKLIFSTWEGGTKGSRFIRYFAMKTEDGTVLCDSETSWVLVNPVSHKLLRPSEYAYQLLPGEKKTAAAIEKIRPENLQPESKYTFVYSDIDANGHVNNGVYLRLAADILSDKAVEKHLKSVMVNFIHECRQNEAVTLYKEEYENYAIVCGKNAEEKSCFEIKVEY